MKKSIRKRISFLVPLLLLLTIGLAGCKEDNIPSRIIDKEEIVDIYNKNPERFEAVAEYLQSIKENVFIKKLEGDKFSIVRSEDNEIKQFEVDDEKVRGDIDYILNILNFRYISEDGNNGIYFVRQTSLSFGQGIAYTKDNNVPDWGLIEVLEQISSKWYYYKEN